MLIPVRFVRDVSKPRHRAGDRCLLAEDWAAPLLASGHIVHDHDSPLLGGSKSTSARSTSSKLGSARMITKGVGSRSGITRRGNQLPAARRAGLMAKIDRIEHEDRKATGRTARAKGGQLGAIKHNPEAHRGAVPPTVDAPLDLLFHASHHCLACELHYTKATDRLYQRLEAPRRAAEAKAKQRRIHELRAEIHDLLDG